MTMLENPDGRATKEWIGSSPDTKIPDRVRLRVFKRYGGICYLSGIKIQPGMAWDIEHVIALSLGGEHREGNMRPALRKYHKAKSATDRAAKAKSDRIQKKHFGIRKPSTMPGSRNSKWKRKMDGTVVER